MNKKKRRSTVRKKERKFAGYLITCLTVRQANHNISDH